MWVVVNAEFDISDTLWICTFTNTYHIVLCLIIHVVFNSVVYLSNLMHSGAVVVICRTLCCTLTFLGCEYRLTVFVYLCTSHVGRKRYSFKWRLSVRLSVCPQKTWKIVDVTWHEYLMQWTIFFNVSDNAMFVFPSVRIWL